MSLGYSDTFTPWDDLWAHAQTRYRLQCEIMDTVRERLNIEPQVVAASVEHGTPKYERVSLSWDEFMALLSERLKQAA